MFCEVSGKPIHPNQLERLSIIYSNPTKLIAMKDYRSLFILTLILFIGCTDDDKPITYTASLASSSNAIEENEGSTTITIQLDKANEGDDIPFELGISGSASIDDDFTLTGGPRVITAESASATITLTATNDTDVEGDEDIIITLSFPGDDNVTVGTNGSVTITITDDDLDFNGSISLEASSVQENAGSTNIEISLDQTNPGAGIPFELTFGGTATEGTDYSLSTEPKVIANGSATTMLTLTISDDSEAEGDETVTITVSFPENENVTVTNSSASLTILDNDAGSSACDGTTDSYSIDLEASNCKESAETNLGVTSEYTVSVSGDARTITSNSIPDHNVGMFPNMGNPNTISAQDKTFNITTNPTKSNRTTSLTTSSGQPRYWFGILDNSIVLAPIAAEFFTNTSTGEDNSDWNENALSSNISLGTDCNNSHVFPNGRYHHHATPSAYVADRNIGSSTTTQIGWAADGFPIYYKYGNKGGTVAELTSSFRLKTTERGGDGVSAPSGCPDGTYTQDYEYVAGLGDLDECNGYDDPTLGYIYVVTDTYPSIPRCFSGTPSDDFSNNL